jgi:hypothetical protein
MQFNYKNHNSIATLFQLLYAMVGFEPGSYVPEVYVIKDKLNNLSGRVI